MALKFLKTKEGKLRVEKEPVIEAIEFSRQELENMYEMDKRAVEVRTRHLEEAKQKLVETAEMLKKADKLKINVSK